MAGTIQEVYHLLTACHMSGDDLRFRLDEVRQLRAQADDLEAEAIREALQRSDWLVARASSLLGYKQTSVLQRLLETRHAAIGEEAKQKRAEMGYSTGRPKKRE